jgi:hypothetical protein
MERMGHTTPAIALRYQHVMANRQAAIATGLDDLADGRKKRPPQPRRARRGHGGKRGSRRGEEPEAPASA